MEHRCGQLAFNTSMFVGENRWDCDGATPGAGLDRGGGGGHLVKGPPREVEAHSVRRRTRSHPLGGRNFCESTDNSHEQPAGLRSLLSGYPCHCARSEGGGHLSRWCRRRCRGAPSVAVRRQRRVHHLSAHCASCCSAVLWQPRRGRQQALGRSDPLPGCQGGRLAHAPRLTGERLSVRLRPRARGGWQP